MMHASSIGSPRSWQRRSAWLLCCLLLCSVLASLVAGTAPLRAAPAAVQSAAPADLAPAEWAAIQTQIAQDQTGPGVTVSNEVQLAVGGSPEDRFGRSVDLDGDTLVVGAPLVDVGGNIDQGAVYVFTRNGTTWSQQAWLVAEDGAALDAFGTAVAVGGNTLIIGAPQAENTRGAVYIFTRNGERWQQQNRITSANATPDALFGSTVDYIDSSSYPTALVGAPGADNAQGAIAFLHGSGDAWQEHWYAASGGQAGDRFGSAVALGDVNYAVIGAPERTVDGRQAQGAAYVFRRDLRNNPDTWMQSAELVPGGIGLAAYDRFGSAVAMSGLRILVGAPEHLSQGAAYLFAGNANGWTPLQRLVAGNTAENDNFGSAVALHGRTAVIGATGGDVGGAERGTAYVFTSPDLDRLLWNEQTRLTISTGAAGEMFGAALALDGNTLAAGVEMVDFGNSTNQGAAYVFTGSGASWSEQQQLTAGIGGPNYRFGDTVALDGNTLLVHAFSEDAVYVFTQNDSTWSVAQRLSAGDARSTGFGGALALDGDTALISGVRTTDDQSVERIVYVFTRTAGFWHQQAVLTADTDIPNFFFGSTLAIEGNTAVVSDPIPPATGMQPQAQLNGRASARQSELDNLAPGKVHIFVRNGDSWTRAQELAADGATAANAFGASLALDGDTLLVGAPLTTINGNRLQGAAYVFNRTSAGWVQQAMLTAAGGMADDLLGWSVALDGDTALLGGTTVLEADLELPEFNLGPGAVYVFTRSSERWTERATLTGREPAPGHFFGSVLALEGDTALITSVFNRNIAEQDRKNSVYVFTGAGSTWTEQARLMENTGTDNESYGRALALDGDRVLIGSADANVNGNPNQGAAYLLTLARSASVLSIARMQANPTSGASVAYRVSFDMAVSGVTASNFALTSDGDLSGARITSVSGSGTTWRVQVDTGSGNGTLRLDLANGTGMAPTLRNAPFSGETYTLDRALPPPPPLPPDLDDPLLYRVYLPLVQR